MPQPERNSIVQANVPDLGAPKLSYTIVEFPDCDPPLYAIGINVNGKPQGYLCPANSDIAVTSPSREFLKGTCLLKGIPPHIAGVTT